MDSKMVKKSIKCCTGKKRKCKNCAYEGCIHRHGDCRDDLLNDTLELIEDQEERIAIMMEGES